MNPEFAEKLQSASHSHDELVALMADIDAEKRSIKSALSQLSSEPDERFQGGRERQVKIRRMKDKISFLTEERELVRKKLSRIKTDRKTHNRICTGISSDFAHAFMAAAERILPDDVFNEVESRAGEILESR